MAPSHDQVVNLEDDRSEVNECGPSREEVSYVRRLSRLSLF